MELTLGLMERIELKKIWAGVQHQKSRAGDLLERADGALVAAQAQLAAAESIPGDNRRQVAAAQGKVNEAIALKEDAQYMIESGYGQIAEFVEKVAREQKVLKQAKKHTGDALHNIEDPGNDSVLILKKKGQ